MDNPPLIINFPNIMKCTGVSRYTQGYRHTQHTDENIHTSIQTHGYLKSIAKGSVFDLQQCLGGWCVCEIHLDSKTKVS